MYYRILGFFKTIQRAIRLQYETTEYKEYGYSCGGFIGWWESTRTGECIAFLDEDNKLWLAW